VAEFENGGPQRHLGSFDRHDVLQRLAEPANGARMQLRDARFVHADLLPDLLHRRLLVVVEADDLLFARWEGRDRGANTIRGLRPLVRRIRPLRLGRNQRFGDGRLVQVVVIGERRRRLDRVDSHDRPTQALLVRTKLVGEIRE